MGGRKRSKKGTAKIREAQQRTMPQLVSANKEHLLERTWTPQQPTISVAVNASLSEKGELWISQDLQQSCDYRCL